MAILPDRLSVHLPDKLSRQYSLTTFQKPIAKRSRLEFASADLPSRKLLEQAEEEGAADRQAHSRQDLIRSPAILPSPNARLLDEAEKTMTY